MCHLYQSRNGMGALKLLALVRNRLPRPDYRKPKKKKERKTRIRNFFYNHKAILNLYGKFHGIQSSESALSLIFYNLQ